MHNEQVRKGQLVAVTDGTLTEEDARAMLERLRWPYGVVCPLDDCGGSESYRIEVKPKTLKSGRKLGPRHLFKCKACKRQFSVTKGTIFEDSKIPLRTWILVMYRMGSSKKGLSAHQVHREFGLSYESAWFMCHRVRFAMRDMGGSKLSGIIEADETYIGGKTRGHPEHNRAKFEAEIKKSGRQAMLTRQLARKALWEKKMPVFGILERGGRVVAMPMKKPTNAKIVDQMRQHIDMPNAHLMTDESKLYASTYGLMPRDTIRHKSEYVRGEIHTQGIESFWATLKRGLVGVYHHVDAGYLAPYVDEFAFRHNTRKISDADRFTSLLGNVEGRVDWYLGKQAKPSEPVERDEPETPES